MTEDAPLIRDTLFLACTRPAMRWGVPMEAYYLNVYGTALIFAVLGRGNPAFWLLFFAFHLPLVALSNRNPNFFHEMKMHHHTRRMAGSFLHAIGGRGTPSSV